MLFELQKLGIEVRDGQQVMLEAREVKNIDELTLLNMAAAMVDGVYQDISEALKPGVMESQIVALATSRLYEMGSDCVEAINAISGERCSPHPHNFTDRLMRPGDQAFFDIIQSYMGYRTCYYRTFSVGRATQQRSLLEQLTSERAAIDWTPVEEALHVVGAGQQRWHVRHVARSPALLKRLEQQLRQAVVCLGHPQLEIQLALDIHNILA